jgi:hypothetical protein
MAFIRRSTLEDGSVRADVHAMLLGGAPDAALDRLHLVGAVPGGVVRVVDLTPGCSDMLGGVDRILLVDGVGERDIAIFLLAPLGVDILASADLLAHGSSRDGY